MYIDSHLLLLVFPRPTRTLTMYIDSHLLLLHWKREPVEYNRYSTVKSGIAAVEYGSVRGIHSDPRGIAMLFHVLTRGIAMLFHSTLRIPREIAIPRMLFHGCYSTLPYLKIHSFGRTHETATVLRGGGVSGGGKNIHAKHTVIGSKWGVLS